MQRKESVTLDTIIASLKKAKTDHIYNKELDQTIVEKVTLEFGKMRRALVVAQKEFDKIRGRCASAEELTRCNERLNVFVDKLNPFVQHVINKAYACQMELKNLPLQEGLTKEEQEKKRQAHIKTSKFKETYLDPLQDFIKYQQDCSKDQGVRSSPSDVFLILVGAIAGSLLIMTAGAFLGAVVAGPVGALVGIAVGMLMLPVIAFAGVNAVESIPSNQKRNINELMASASRLFSSPSEPEAKSKPRDFFSFMPRLGCHTRGF